MLLMTNGMFAATGKAIPTQNAQQQDSIVIAFDIGHNGYHTRDFELSEAVYSQLEAWGYQVVNITEFNSSSLSNVDILITFAPTKSITLPQFTTAELQALTDWFNQGNKAIWVTGDSDFSDTNGTVAAGINGLLEAIGSNVLVEQASVESDLNADGAVYRVRPGTYNTEDAYVVRNFYRDNVNLADAGFFHGPAPLIGKLSNGTLVRLENNDAFFDQYNAHWIIAATNNGTYSSWINRGSLDGLTYQVHDVDEEGSFIMMTAQEKTVSGGKSRIVVSGEAIMTMYKNMFNTTNEAGDPSTNKDLVKNTMEWLSFIDIPEATTTTAAEESSATSGTTPSFELLIAVISIVTVTTFTTVKRKRRNH